MRPDKVNKYLNRRMARIAHCDGDLGEQTTTSKVQSELKLQRKSSDWRHHKNKRYEQLYNLLSKTNTEDNDGWDCVRRPAEISSQYDISQSATRMKSLSKTRAESSCSSVTQLTISGLGRPQVMMEEDKSMGAREETIRVNPVLPFTLEEEFRVIDFLVRIEDYLAKRDIFINRNFGDNINFPDYRQLTMENAVCISKSRKLPYNPVMEERLFNLNLKFCQMNIDQFFDDMKYLSVGVKMEMLATSFPALHVVYYSLIETNRWTQPLSIGRERVGNIRMKDMDRFNCVSSNLNQKLYILYIFGFRMCYSNKPGFPLRNIQY